MPNAADWFAAHQIPLQPWIDNHFFWLSLHVRPYFEVIRAPLGSAIDALAAAIAAAPPALLMAVVFLAVWQISGLLHGFFVTILLALLGMLGIWADTAQTFALIIASVLLCLVVGLPLGFASARHDRFDAMLKPVLDLMQTLPAFVYLVPIVLAVGIGSVPGVLVAFVFAVPPTIRLTSLGLRNVPPPMVEAAEALGASPMQILFKVEIPNALPTLLLGINQTVVMALAMVTYASMIGVGGLGRLVLEGIGQLDMGMATVGGLGIVVLAILFGSLLTAGKRRARGPAWLASPYALARTAFRRPAFHAHPKLPASQLHGDENHA